MKKLLSCAFLSVVAACSDVAPPTAFGVAQPKTPPVRNITSFAGALKCMDQLFLAKRQARVLISSTGFPDKTQTVNVSADDMLIGAINGMNRRSRAFVFLDQSREVASGQIKYLTDTSRLKPQVYVRGAISQFDKSTVTASESFGGGSSTAAVSGALQTFNISRSRVLSIVTVDMHLVSNPGRIILPGMSVSNSMVIVQNTFGASATGFVTLTPLNMGVSIAKIESSGQAVRNLVELGAIELLGKYTGVPYWTCLDSTGTTQTSPTAHTSFANLNDTDRISQIQAKLAALGLLADYTDGTLDAKTRSAISRFQAQNGLIANGRITANLAKTLIQATSNQRGVTTAPLRLTPAALQITRLGQRALAVGDPLRISVKPNRDVYVHCYHQSQNGAITRVFPSTDRQNNLVRRGQSLIFPPASAGFQIVMEKGVTERFLCVSAARDIRGDLPPQLARYNLTALPVASLAAVLAQHQAIEVGNIGHKTVRYTPKN